MSAHSSANIHFISAGAGSGKTWSLTHKLQELLASGAVTPAGVIATTFTRLAAGELRERVRAALIEAGQVSIANQMEQALIGTVNGVCGDILQRFAFEAGMPPDQQVLDEAQGDILFYRAMELALQNDKALIRQMNSVCYRLQITDTRTKALQWRQEVKKIADAARANNQAAAAIRDLGKHSADSLLAYFPGVSSRELDRLLLNAIEAALKGIDTVTDTTKATLDYVSQINGIRAALYKQRATWPEWISLSKKMPGAKSKSFAEPIADIAMDYDKHPRLRADIRFFAERAFAIAAASLDAYQELKRQKGLIDFVDQEQRLYQLLDKPEVRDTLREELQLLMVDEFQDTSPIQLALFLKLSQLADQVIWVGDIKQSIYGFRGSDPALMDAVVQRVTSAGKAPEILRNSWRSTPELVAYVNNLFTPAFADTLAPEQVVLEPARKPCADQPAVELWRLQGKKKEHYAAALASGLNQLLAADRTVVDKETGTARPLAYSDIAILCRTHSNLAEVATALSNARLPIRYQRPGLLATPEGHLAMACLRRLIDPRDTLASAEIHSLTTCTNPEEWIAQRMAQLEQPEARSHTWLEDVPGPVAALRDERARLHFLTPVETLRAALAAGDVRAAVYRWGPSEQRSQHRLNNLAALLDHAAEYLNQCETQNQPATAAGLVLWLYLLAEAEEDTQATGGGENAIQLVTHHGAKGLEWPIVVAMDMDAKLKPRLWGLSVLPSPDPISLDDPLAKRTLRYWPAFAGQNTTKVAVLDMIDASPEGERALQQEIAEAKRLLYVSLTRPRDGLILTMNKDANNGEWMDTLEAPWMLPQGDTLALPDGTAIPSGCHELSADDTPPERPAYTPTWLDSTAAEGELLPLRLSPSSIPPVEGATIGAVIELGERLEITGEYDPATLGSALHAVIATSILGQDATQRVLADFGAQDTISAEAADECTRRLLDAINTRFQPVQLYTEYPVHYTTDSGQVIGGWIDLLVETPEGFVLIDHKASPRARSDWEEIALGYSGQLEAYAAGVAQVTGKPVLGRWVHFGVTGGLVEVAQ